MKQQGDFQQDSKLLLNKGKENICVGICERNEEPHLQDIGKEAHVPKSVRRLRNERG